MNKRIKKKYNTRFNLRLIGFSFYKLEQMFLSAKHLLKDPQSLAYRIKSYEEYGATDNPIISKED